MAGYIKEEPFELPIDYKGRELILKARLVQMGYSYKIIVEVDERPIIFEPDEERNFRAIVDNENNKHISADMVQTIADSLEKHLR